MDAATMVKRVRALSGITRKELAELAGLSPSTVGRIEQGALDPTWGTLSRILESTGYQINGETVVSAGDPTAIAAARPVLESLFASAAKSMTDGLADTTGIVNVASGEINRSVGDSLAATTGIANVAVDDINRSVADAIAETIRMPISLPVDVTPQRVDAVITEWLKRWDRAGWLSDHADIDDAVNVAVVAGNAGKIARRNVVRRSVVAPDGWRDLARRLEAEGIDYAVSGLVAARQDRATAASASPVIYVEDPALTVTRIGLEEAEPGRGVLLIAPGGDELERTEIDGGIRFVTRAQGVLDAFAGSGREPDKAEDLLRSLLTTSA